MTSRDAPKHTRQTEQLGKPATAARTPRQARGRERVERILDAAAEMIVDKGPPAVTMHDLSRRAHTSIGSLYHFFPDRESVLDALYQRHRIASREISRELGKIDLDQWRALSASAAIDRLLTPYIAYLRSHADFLPLMHNRMSSDHNDDFVRTIRHVLDARLPHLSAAAREAYATMLHTVGAGAVWMSFQTDPRSVDRCLHELPRVLSAYLAEIEAAAGRQARPEDGPLSD